ncbi:MAG TPA: TolC family protein [Flavobacterium sp.]|jgi:outer membrane protein TolC
MKKTILIILFLCSLAVRSQEAAKTYSFTLEEAISHALQHNYTVINAGRDIQIAEQKKRETTAMGLPQINAGVDYLYNIQIPRSVISASSFALPGMPPPADPDAVIITEFGAKQSMTPRATLSQLLFDGSYIVALRASKTYLQYYKNFKQKTDNEVREMIVASYGDVLVAEESIAILERNKTTLDKTLSDTRKTFENGLIEEETVEQLQITQFTVNSSLNNARRLREIAYNMLKINLGLSIEDQVTLTDRLDNVTTNNLDLSITGSEFDINNNIDYKIAQNFVDQRRLEFQREKSRALPTLSTSLNYGINSYADKQFTFFEKDQRWLWYSNVGVTLNVPIFSSFARSARTQQARIAFDQAKTQLTESEQRLKLQYANARSQYEFSVEEYNNSKSNLNLAERIERKQQTKFTEGLSSSFDFAEAQRQLYTAQQNYLQSMINVINRRAELENITNGK